MATLTTTNTGGEAMEVGVYLARRLGRDAAFCGDSDLTNPYPFFSDLWEEWQASFWATRYAR